jgi:4-hydroxy-tetrahydrodipicolinate synthase
MLKGVFTAIVTPFKNGEIDYDCLTGLIDFNLESGVAGIVPCGTTGETPTMSDTEYREMIAFTVKKLKGKGKVIAGAGANSTKKSIENARVAKAAGADAALIVTPYYNKPTQKGLILHYEAIAKEVDIPIVIYNVPGRTGVNILPETIETLAKNKNIVGIKEASGSLIQIAELRNRVSDNFSILSGDDQLFLPTLSVGGDGIISVASNVIPGEMSEIYKLWSESKSAKAKDQFLKVFPLTCALFLETNPIPVKAALHLLGKIGYEYRLPLCRMGDSNFKKLKEVMTETSIL